MHGSGVLKWCLMDVAEGPELKPVEVVGSDFDVIIHATVLEEKFLIAPEGRNSVRTGDDPANQLVFTTELRWLIECKHLEHYSVHWNYRHLVLEVVLILIGPSIDIIWFDVDLIWPVRVFLLLSILIELSYLHNGSGTDVISDSC